MKSDNYWRQEEEDFLEAPVGRCHVIPGGQSLSCFLPKFAQNMSTVQLKRQYTFNLMLRIRLHYWLLILVSFGITGSQGWHFGDVGDCCCLSLRCLLLMQLSCGECALLCLLPLVCVRICGGVFVWIGLNVSTVAEFHAIPLLFMSFTSLLLHESPKSNTKPMTPSPTLTSPTCVSPIPLDLPIEKPLYFPRASVVPRQVGPICMMAQD